MKLKDKKDEVELMTFNLNYDRWYDLYFPKSVAAIADEMMAHDHGSGRMAGEEIEIPVTDIDELDRFFETRESKRWMSSGEIPLPNDFGVPASGGRRV